MIIRGLLQLLLLPVYIPLRLLYVNILARDATILYSWYRNRKDYEAIIHASEDDPDTSKTWKEWCDGAEKMEEACHLKKQRFIKVIVRPTPLYRWLEKHHLDNHSANRERYINAVYQEACKRGIELGPSKIL